MIAVNWNIQEDVTNTFWRRNISQMRVETEFRVSKDTASWKTSSEAEQGTFKKALTGLTGLDTHQADDGMPLVMLHTTDLRKKAVCSFMTMIEQIHVKSHSHIFTTLLPPSETSYLLDEWALEEPRLKYKSDKVVANYHKLWSKGASMYNQYMARVTDVFLETFLFFSGFYYPLYLAGQGKMTTSGEIVRKTLLDESIRDMLTGLDTQHLRDELSENEKQKADQEMYELPNDLYLDEESYTKMLYDSLGATEDVLDYVKYNGDKVLSNLGFEPHSGEHEFNPIIESALDTTIENHDFFSVKDDGYVLALSVEALQDDGSVFDDK